MPKITYVIPANVNVRPKINGTGCGATVATLSAWLGLKFWSLASIITNPVHSIKTVSGPKYKNLELSSLITVMISKNTPCEEFYLSFYRCYIGSVSYTQTAPVGDFARGLLLANFTASSMLSAFISE